MSKQVFRNHNHFNFSVMEKLPPTSYVRMVDIWLITTQTVPFLLVAMTTTIELYQNEAESIKINHHGFARFSKYDSNQTPKGSFKYYVIHF